MRVLINAASANTGGAVTYLSNVLGQLRTLAPDDEFIVVAPGATLTRIGDLLEHPRFQAVAYPHPPIQSLRRILFDQWDVPRLARHHAVDLLFSSNGFGSFLSPCPQVLLVRNSIFFCPKFEARYRALGRSLREIRLRRLLSQLSIRASRVVLFPTEAMKDLVATRADLSGKPTHAIHYGFDRERFFRPGAAVPEIARRMRGWRENGEATLLAVSGYAVHKNFDTLVEALALLRAEGRRVQLVMTFDRTGVTDIDEYDAMIDRIAELGVGDAVHLSGLIPYEQLQHVYAEASVFGFASFTESFGQTMVEAMACALPIVAADVPVNREVLGDAALFFDAFDARACADTVAQLLDETQNAGAFRERARIRAKAFSWHRYAESLLQVLRRAARGGAG